MPEVFAMGWHNVVLYPSGVEPDGVRMRPTVKLPHGWDFASSLDVQEKSGETGKRHAG